MSRKNEIPEEILNRYVNNVAEILSEELGFSRHPEYLNQLHDTLADPNFFEFWFPGNRHGSFKLLVGPEGLWVFDQERNTVLAASVKRANEALKGLTLDTSKELQHQ